MHHPTEAIARPTQSTPSQLAKHPTHNHKPDINIIVHVLYSRSIYSHEKPQDEGDQRVSHIRVCMLACNVQLGKRGFGLDLTVVGEGECWGQGTGYRAV